MSEGTTQYALVFDEKEFNISTAMLFEDLDDALDKLDMCITANPNAKVATVKFSKDYPGGYLVEGYTRG